MRPATPPNFTKHQKCSSFFDHVSVEISVGVVIDLVGVVDVVVVVVVGVVGVVVVFVVAAADPIKGTKCEAKQ